MPDMMIMMDLIIMIDLVMIKREPVGNKDKD